jgi:lipopolysaccharide transport system ATP-binding protein
MSVVVEAQNISKRFFLGERNQRTFFEDIAHRSRHGLKLLVRSKPSGEEKRNAREFWALKDISFKISQGETLAIIGENGAGKSTLLKVLSRITQPTTGSVKVYGRLASLLEVGTGFHPEFSGRDNVFLNGAMLGLSVKEVRGRFDQIIEFSGLEKFIDVPVKNYSSGMYVRLAFSVAAHLNPEIVILDEVLAVGDALFQKKCFDRMEEIINEGHAAILVSHGMSNIRRMSQTCMWLKQGCVEMFGPTHQVASEYERQTAHAVVAQTQHAAPEPLAHLAGWSIESPASKNAHVLTAKPGSVTLLFEIDLIVPVPIGKIAVSLADVQGLVLFTRETTFSQSEAGRIMLSLELPSLPLKPGEYIISCTLTDSGHRSAFLRAAPELTILPEKNAAGAVYGGILNLPARMAVKSFDR